MCLALFPCSCNAQTENSFDTKIEQVSVLHEESNLSLDICTPFCACSSFHNPNFWVKNNFDLNKVDEISAKMISIYNENQTSSFLNSLWRPPKA